jgi:hypothetical protein
MVSMEDGAVIEACFRFGVKKVFRAASRLCTHTYVPMSSATSHTFMPKAGEEWYYKIKTPVFNESAFSYATTAVITY